MTPRRPITQDMLDSFVASNSPRAPIHPAEIDSAGTARLQSARQ